MTWAFSPTGSSLAPFRSWWGCVVTLSLRCQIAGCERDVLASLAGQGICLGHYLEIVFVRLETALDLCQRNKPVEPAALEWLLSQGDLVAQTLAKGGGATDPTERTRLLELLLCLANLHEYAAHHSIEPAVQPIRSAQTGEATRPAQTGRMADAH